MAAAAVPAAAAALAVLAAMVTAAVVAVVVVLAPAVAPAVAPAAPASAAWQARLQRRRRRRRRWPWPRRTRSRRQPPPLRRGRRPPRTARLSSTCSGQQWRTAIGRAWRRAWRRPSWRGWLPHRRQHQCFRVRHRGVRRGRRPARRRPCQQHQTILTRVRRMRVIEASISGGGVAGGCVVDVVTAAPALSFYPAMSAMARCLSVHSRRLWLLRDVRHGCGCVVVLVIRMGRRGDCVN